MAAHYPLPPIWARSTVPSTVLRAETIHRAETGAVNRDGGRLLDAQPGDRPRDDELLDLLGALEDVVDLRVAVHALDRVLARVAVATVDLDGALGDPHRDAAGLELRLRSLGIGVAAVAGEPRGAVHEQSRRVDLGDHVGEHEGDRLVLDDRLPEGDALLRVLQRLLVRGARDANGHRCDRGSRRLERRHRRL